MHIREGGPQDIGAVLALGDEAVRWMNARGNTTQWGTTPWTGNAKREALVRTRARGGGMRIMQTDEGEAVGVLVATGEHAQYVPAPGEPELYINLLLTSRRHRGHGIGAALIEHAKAMASDRGVDLIRVDCWAGEEGNLVRVYEKYGFRRIQPFLVGEWPGMLLGMRLSES
jgi:GNAT superfamily N-acetyltransferase